MRFDDEALTFGCVVYAYEVHDVLKYGRVKVKADSCSSGQNMHFLEIYHF